MAFVPSSCCLPHCYLPPSRPPHAHSEIRHGGGVPGPNRGSRTSRKSSSPRESTTERGYVRRRRRRRRENHAPSSPAPDPNPHTCKDVAFPSDVSCDMTLYLRGAFRTADPQWEACGKGVPRAARENTPHSASVKGMGGAAESQIANVSAWDPLAPDILPKAFFFLVPPVVRLSPKEKIPKKFQTRSV